MEKIIVNPLSVRGLGDIVSPKILADFDVCDGVLATSTDTVNGVSMTVFTTSYRSGSRLLKSGDGFIVYTPDLTSMSVSVLLKTKSGSVISSASISCIIDNETTLTATTNSSGKANFTIPFVEGESYYSLRFVYAGTGSVAGCSIYGQIFVGTPTDLTLSGVKDIVAVDETSRLTATLTGLDLNDEPMGIPFVTVDIYACREYHRLLDAVTVSCESTGDNYCYSIGLDELDFDLSGDFSLEFDYRNTVNGGRLCIGDSSSWSAGARAGDNYLYMGTSTAGNGGYGTKHNTTTDNSSTGAVAAGTTLHYKIMRHGNTIAYYLNDVLKGTKTAEWVSDVTDWSIYLQCWGTGDYTVKNVCLDLEPDVGDSPILTINASPTTVSLGESVTISGNFDPNNEVSQLDDWVIQIYEGNTQVTTAMTDSNGDYSVSITPSVVGSHVYHAYRASSAEFDEVTSSNVRVTVSKITSTISLSAASASVTVGNNVSLSGTLSVGSGESVKIYQGDTLIDTVTTTTDGAFTKSVTGLGVGSYTFKAVYDGDSTHTDVTSNNVSVSVTVITTSLSINVPALVYSDVFDVTGTLTAGGVGLSGATVNMVWNDGTSHTETATTDSNGEVTFHRSAPTTITDYSFQLTYAGDSTHGNSSSSSVTRTVGKETSVLTVTNPVDNSTVSSNSFNVSGTLLTNDGEAITGASILVKKSSSTLTTLTTDSSGAFSGTVTGELSSGSNTITIEYETTTYYTGASTSRTVSYSSLTPTTMTISNTNDVLSYYDSDSTTVSATVLDQIGNPMSGQSVSFTFKHGATTVETQSANTNASGVASVSYSSKGAGDLNISVECMSVSETYSIEDCLIAQLSETTVTNSSGTKISSIGMDTIPNIQNTNFKFEFDGTGNGVLNVGSKNNWSSSSANYRVTIGYADSKNYWSVRTTSTSEGYGSSASTSTEYHYKIERQGTTVCYYVDDTLIQTKTNISFFNNHTSWSIYSIIWGSGTSTIKNIKLKPL